MQNKQFLSLVRFSVRNTFTLLFSIRLILICSSVFFLFVLRKFFWKANWVGHDSLIYYTTDVYLSYQPLWRIYLHVFTFICENIFLFMITCENLIFFARIYFYLWSSVGIFSYLSDFLLVRTHVVSICDNLSLSIITSKNHFYPRLRK